MTTHPILFREQQDEVSGTGFDLPLLLFVGILLFAGAMLVMSSSAAVAYAKEDYALSIFVKHLIRMGAGIALLIALAFSDYHRLLKIAEPLMLATLVLLLLVLFWPMKPGASSHRQLYLGSLNLQPAEIAKFAVVLYLSYCFSRREATLPAETSKQFMLRCSLPVGLGIGLILCETNLSMAVIVLVSAFAMLFLTGIPMKTLGKVALVVVPILAAVAWLIPYTHARLTGYWMGILEPSQARFHTRQSLIGLGKGGLLGQGPGQSTWAYSHLPIPHKDSIFSILGEELGFLGCIVLLAIFALFLWRGMAIARKAPDPFGYYLANGILLVIACTFFINVGVAVGLLPPTGQPLPFVSYGGSSLVMSLGAVGILLNISRQSAHSEEEILEPSLP
jgi:cell division protein FtsW